MLEPGRGRVDLMGFGDSRRLGAAVAYKHRISRLVAALAEGWASLERDEPGRWKTDHGVMGGLRVSW